MAIALAATLALATGCDGIRIPQDPEGTLERVSGGELRVGASADDGRVLVDGAEVSGPLAAVVEDFAESIDADVEWSVGSEETLVTKIEDGQLDLAIGGMTGQTPWVDKVAVTREFTDLPEVDGPVVMLARLGENRFVVALETHLQELQEQQEATR
ncbi:hypothetical protein J5V96_05040 [Microbacterium sp. NEAU-LLB]|uniref:Solute-binding protein family 3/N-terminal domain-containing protein n=2 Tax=Microbacterium stercoris TaxID=2820289 RepID=A0A939TM66_9MICO|nr:hypothetical protein [Microbacterium stercoris]